ncbi:YcnI family copper-binding membrane protein [Massilia endophytica]|uniref:YcnI family copper-binding membrane protein n=1 Tax=Massilia endophytica TaxID=2899220 RepID=UPI001E4AE9B7|nr:YcnI family protein [Massilia endophytica]UGQ47901.1 YcnI family protein [Massilia endophytica]
MKKTIAMAAMLLAATAHAHVTLEQRSATAGSYQKLTFRVGHGCEGSATRAITVVLPEGVSTAKPMPKQGWKIDISPQKIRWTGGPLPDDFYDEFTMQVKLSQEAGKRYFKVVQTCMKGSMAWDQLPDGSGTKLKAPAPVLDVQPAEATSAHVH